MAIMRSIARRARLATGAGTVMRCCICSSARFTLGSVVTFMYAHDAISFAGKNRLDGFSRRSRCRIPTSVATMNSSASDSAGRLIIPSVERICTPSGSTSPADIASSTLVEQPHSG